MAHSVNPKLNSATQLHDQARRLQDQAEQLRRQARQLKDQAQQLKEQDELMQGIIVNIPTGLYVYAPVYESAEVPVDFRLILLNPLAAQHLDRSDQARMGELLSNLLPSMGIPNLLVQTIAVFESRQTQSLETAYQHQGVRGWLKLSISRYDHRIIVTTIDITLLKQVQINLQKVTDTMHSMLDGSLVAIAQLKAIRDQKNSLIDLVYEGANEKGAALLNRSVNELVGQSFLTLFPGGREAIFDEYVRVIDTGESRRFENYYQAEPVAGWFDLSIIKNDDGVVVSYLDIKDRKAAEQQLEKAFQDLQTAKTQSDQDLIRLQIAEEEIGRVLQHERDINTHQSQFITFVSHQFRNPMTGILLAAEALAKYSELAGGPLLTQKVAQYAQQTRQEIQRLDALLTKVLFQDRLHSLKIALQLEAVELSVFFEQVIERQRQQHADYGRVRFQREPGAVWANVDPLIFEQVVENLMSNALKYSSASGKPVDVGVSLQESDIRITVTDYGIGIPAAELAHIGKRFFRGSNTSFISGIGLGLSLSRQFIEQHGGRLEVASELNHYTQCTLVLPRLPGP